MSHDPCCKTKATIRRVRAGSAVRRAVQVWPEAEVARPPVQILSILLEKSGQLVTREELRQRLWPADTATFVDFEHGLNTAIRKLRAALGDEAETPQYIETLPRRGYRFIGQLPGAKQPSKADENQPPDPAISPIAGREARTGGPTWDSTALPNLASPVANVILQRMRRHVRSAALLAILSVLAVLTALVVRSAWFGSSVPKIIAAKQLTFSGIAGNWMARTVDTYPSIQSDGRHVYYFCKLTPSGATGEVCTCGWRR